MKTLYALVALLCLTSLADAQAPCSSFCVTNIDMLNAEGISTMVISIQYTDEPDEFINYPYVSAVVVGNDTVAEGFMNLFGQFSNSAQQYTANSEINVLPDDFECNIHFKYDKTECVLSYPCTNVSIENETHLAGINFYPNPAHDFIIVEKNDSQISFVELYDSFGKQVNYYSLKNEQNRIDTSQLPSGSYLLRWMDSSRKQIHTEWVIIR